MPNRCSAAPPARPRRRWSLPAKWASFLELMTYGSQPLLRELSGLDLEYRIVQIYCRDAGRKEALLGFSLWRDTPGKKPARQRVAMSTPLPYFFESTPAVLVRLRVRDHDGK